MICLHTKLLEIENVNHVKEKLNHLVEKVIWYSEKSEKADRTMLDKGISKNLVPTAVVYLGRTVISLEKVTHLLREEQQYLLPCP